MSAFFDSEIIKDSLEDINKLQEDVYGKLVHFHLMNHDEQVDHVSKLTDLLDKQRIMYTRLSLSDDPVEEVKIVNEILKSIGLRNRGVKIISCPSCARQGFEVIETVKILEDKLSHIKEPITLSIIGCVVNGPGEASQTDIGITGGGGESNMLYLNGIQTKKLNNNEIISKVVEQVEKKASEIQKKAK